MSQGFRGRLFGPDLLGAGVDVSADWEQAQLRVQLGATVLVAQSPEIRSAGFNDERLRFTFESEKGIYALMVTASVEEVLAGMSPESRQQLLAHVQAKRRLARGKQVWIWGSVAAVVLVIGAVLWGISSAASWGAALARVVPPEHEAVLGELVLAETRRNLQVTSDGSAVDALRTVGEKLVPQSRFKYRWFVAKSSELNAFAAPGGVVVATTGLMEAAESAEELAGVLAHEIAHVELRHGTAALIKSFGLRAAAELLLGDAASADLAVALTRLKFSRDAELDADDEGLRRLRMAAIAPEGMLRLFEKLHQRAESGVVPPEFLSTHPNMGERVERIRRKLDVGPRYGTVTLPVDWPRVKASLPR